MKRFVWLFLIVLFVAALWSGGWFFAAGQVREQLAKLATNDGETAPQVICGNSNVTGFPFRIDVACDQAVIVVEDLMVSAAGIRASVQVDNPTHMVFSAASPITTEDAFYGSSTRLAFTALQGSFRVTTADLIKGLSGEGWRIARMSLVGDGLDWVDTIGTELPLARASHAELQVIDVPELHDKTNGTSALAIYAVARDVAAQFYRVGNGNGEVQLQVTGLPDDLPKLASPSAIADWQAAGGKVDVVRINGTDGDDLIDASGTLALDANRMVEGEITYSNRGIRERLAAYVDPLVLSVLAGLPQPDGTFKQALQFAGGALRIGGIPLVNLTPLY
jgi:hypothetical protein